MTLNWRGHAARIETYFNAGRDCIDKFRGLLVAGAALKILGVPLEWIAWGAPGVVIGYVVVGWAWLRWGWYRQGQEVSYLQNLNPVLQWQVWALFRLLIERRLPVNGYERGTLPEEVLQVMESTRA